MQIKSNGGQDFKDLARRLREAGSGGRKLRRDLTKRLNAALEPIVKDVQRAVRTIEVTGSHGGGAKSRSRFIEAAEMRRLAKAAAKGKQARRRRGPVLSTGLRESIARGVRARVQYSGFRYGAQIIAHTSQLPQSQRNLPRYLDSPKGWRHPVFGNREVWVGEKGRPWFAVTISRHVNQLRREIVAEINQTLKQL